MKLSFRHLFIVIFFLLNCVALFGRSTPNVPIDDPVYRDVDKLMAAGLIKGAIYGQRPWSRQEIARMITGARQRLSEKTSDQNPEIALMAGEILARLEKDYHEELAEKKAINFHLLDQASLDATVLKSPSRPVPANNGLGSIKAEINPLVSYREGRKFVHGGTLGLETVHWAEISDYFSFYARPRFEVLDPRAGKVSSNALAQQLYGKFTLGNVEIEAGRDSVIWGSGEHGGVLASNNSRNLDLVKISNDSPFVHPWILKYLGPTKYSFFVANLGFQSVYRDAYFYGFSASIKPASFLEIGFEHQVTFGGKGAPDFTPGDLVSEFFFRRPLKHSQNLADHRIGMNVRAEIPQLHRAVVYGEGVFEDLGRPAFWPQLTQQMGFLSGLYFPLLTSDGTNDLRIEYEHIPAAYGRHSVWTSGLSEDNLLRGSELGPDGHAIHSNWGHLLKSGIRLASAAHYENCDSNAYIVPPSSKGKVILVDDNPQEHRLRFGASLYWQMHDQLLIQPQFGYERVWNFSFNPQVARNNFLGAIYIKWLPRL